jgi:sugar lactone lactonase YvrE
MLDNGRRGESMPKIVAWDTKKDKLHKVIYLPPPATIPTSFVNDIALDPERPLLYVTDPAAGDDAALIVVNRETGAARRVLQGHYSVVPENIPLFVEGQLFQGRTVDGEPVQPQVGVNPIAVDRKGNWVFFGPLKGRTLYRIDTRHLGDLSLSPQELRSRVEGYSEKPICDGISIDSKGNIYVADLTNNAIGVIDAKERRYQKYYSDARFRWPDGLCFGIDGKLNFFTCQLHRTAALNRGKDETEPPFYVFRLKALSSGSVGR